MPSYLDKVAASGGSGTLTVQTQTQTARVAPPSKFVVRNTTPMMQNAGAGTMVVPEQPGVDPNAPCTQGRMLNPFFTSPRDEWDLNRCITPTQALARALMYADPPYLSVGNIPDDATVDQAVTSYAKNNGVTKAQAIKHLVNGDPLPAGGTGSTGGADTAQPLPGSYDWVWYALGAAVVVGGVGFLVLRKRSQ